MPSSDVQSGVNSGGGSVTQTSTLTSTIVGGGASVGAGSTVAGGSIESGQANIENQLSGSASSTPVTLGTGSTAGNITISEGSPQDVALAAQAYEDSLQIVQGENAGLLSFAMRSETASQDLAKNSTATTSEQFNQLLLILGGLGIIGTGVYYYFKKG